MRGAEDRVSTTFVVYCQRLTFLEVRAVLLNPTEGLISDLLISDRTGLVHFVPGQAGKICDGRATPTGNVLLKDIQICPHPPTLMLLMLIGADMSSLNATVPGKSS